VTNYDKESDHGIKLEFLESEFVDTWRLQAVLLSRWHFPDQSHCSWQAIAEIGVWCVVERPFDEKRLSIGLIVLFKPILNSKCH
jgi:hypothetical protein